VIIRRGKATPYDYKKLQSSSTEEGKKEKEKKRRREEKKDKTLRKAQPTSQPIYPSW
jgi:hypothetical protein